jgi:threonine aldolase
MHAVDLRSDTITQPTTGMWEAIRTARLGDDVFGDDPTVAALQERSAELLGKEAALFVPSGTMANQVAIRTWTEPGDEIVVEEGAHIYQYEGGAYAALSGVSIKCIVGERGLLDAEQVRLGIRPPGGWSHFPVTRLVCVENSANRGGGTVYSPARTEAIAEVAREHGLRLHLDGARLFNAAAALEASPAELAAPFDSISFCLSKGLGCPVGSLVVGSRAFVERAHRFRKMFGGGLRQAGVLAAAGLYALEHHLDRLTDDHRRARRLAGAVAAMPGLRVDEDRVETNMLYADVSGTGLDAAAFIERLEARGVRVVLIGPAEIRAVTHLHVDDAAIDRAIEAFAAVAAGAPGPA